MIKPLQIILDSQCYTYLVTVMNDMKKPTDQLAAEKTALLRCFLYGNLEFTITPTVNKEWQKIKDIKKRDIHQKFGVLIDTVQLFDIQQNQIVENKIKKIFNFILKLMTVKFWLKLKF